MLTSSYQVSRPLSDFVLFSSRPWFYIIPSPKNPFLGFLGATVIGKITASGYFFAKDYFQGEHDGSYLGFGLYALLILSVVLIVRHKKFVLTDARVYTLLKYCLIAFGLLILSMPPYFTIHNIEIYLPSYLLFRFFPMFRVLSRLSILILICLLMALSQAVLILETELPKVYSKLRLILPIAVVLILLETYVPLKVFDDSRTPLPYEYMGSISQNASTAPKFLVYPYNHSLEALYWLPVHKSELLNIRFYTTPTFEAEALTKILNTETGMHEALELHPQYILVFKNATPQDLDFFNNSHHLTLVSEYPDSILYAFKPGN